MLRPRHKIINKSENAWKTNPFSLFPPFQASFSSVSSSFDYFLSQQEQQYHNIKQSPPYYQQDYSQGQQQSSLEIFSDILFSPNRHYDFEPPITQFKEEKPFFNESLPPTPGTTISEQDQDILFESSSSDELAILSLRSNSDPQISNHSNLSTADANPILPSFQETYQIKNDQLEDLGLKMDEDCYNVASPHQSVTAFHHPHNLHQSILQENGYGFQQHTESQYMPSNNFYQQYEPQIGMVSYPLNKYFLKLQLNKFYSLLN